VKDPTGPGIDPAELEELRHSVRVLREQLASRFGKPGLRAPGGGESALEAEEEQLAEAKTVQEAELSEAEPASEGLAERLARVDLMDLFEKLRRRLSVLGMQERSAEVDEFGLDPIYLERARPLLDLLYDRWWRVVVSGAENLPREGGVLFVANHSGILPYDGLMIAHAVERHAPWRPRPRFLVADWLVTLPFSQPFLARVGGVRACPENAKRLLDGGHAVVAFPEGQKGALKLFRDRYRLQRFGRGGFVSLAVRERATLVPVAVIGAEEAHPILFRPGLAQRVFGVPFPITPTFPHLGPVGLLPLPSQWRIRFGEPVDFAAVPASSADDPLYVNRTREEIRGRVQDLVDQELRRRKSVWS
jgi:1-acyl-sn-glycerol-3-phosphate acyltransferase